jgi:methyltransferase (TIGR00027 family)
MVAAARALASEATNPIINDPFAAPLVRAVGLDFFRRLVDGEVAESEGYDGSGKDLGLETDSIAVRTRFFDDFFLNAARDGVRQAVILAAGLDARAYRLSWPPGSVVYEVDQPAVIEFKSATMSSLAAAPTAERRTVSIDLREDWPAALCARGFDAQAPTAWLAEGLLMYLPADAQDRLFAQVTGLSTAGSRIAVETMGVHAEERRQRIRERFDRIALEVGLQDSVDIQGLMYDDPDRADVAEWLNGNGWRAAAVTSRDEMRRLGRWVLPPEESDSDSFSSFVTAVKD